MASRIVIILFVVIALFVYSDRESDWRNNIYKYDTFNYHLYLPAAVIYKDIKTLSFQPQLNQAYQAVSNEDWYCIDSLSNGKRVNRYAVGIALHEAPFFLLAHYYCTHFKTIFVPDGCSVPYQYASILSNIFWVIIGLFVLRRFLKQYFSDGITAITLLAIALGTNLYHYTVFEPGMSHPYSVLYFAWVLLLTSKLYRTEKSKYFYLLAIAIGGVALLRPSNLLIALIPLLWGITNLQLLKSRLAFLIKHYRHIIIACVVFIIIISPQLLYWHYTSDSWIYDGYSDEGFIWSEPKILEGLFGFRKGWYIYTPVAFIATIGFFFLKDQLKQQRYLIPLFLGINIYIIFSWWNWWYGGGFGSRPLIEYLSIMCIPLASLLLYIKERTKKAVYGGVITLLLLLVALNIFQSYQYSKHILHYHSMTSKYYIKTFLKTEPKTEYEQYLISSDEFYDELFDRYRKANSK